MYFRVLKGKQGLMSTDDKSTTYSNEILKNMSESGHTFQINDKKATVQQVIKEKEKNGYKT